MWRMALERVVLDEGKGRWNTNGRGRGGDGMGIYKFASMPCVAMTQEIHFLIPPQT